MKTFILRGWLVRVLSFFQCAVGNFQHQHTSQSLSHLSAAACTVSFRFLVENWFPPHNAATMNAKNKWSLSKDGKGKMTTRILCTDR